MVASRRFVQALGIDPGQAERCAAEMVDGVLVAKLPTSTNRELR